MVLLSFSQFSDTQLAAEDPMRAARAYDNMKAVIEEADAAVTLASMEASNAYDKVSCIFPFKIVVSIFSLGRP